MEILLDSEMDEVAGGNWFVDGVKWFFFEKGIDASLALVDYVAQRCMATGCLDDVTIYNAMGDFNAANQGQDSDPPP